MNWEALGAIAAYHFDKAQRQKSYWWPMIRKNVEFYLSRPGGRAWWQSQGRNMLDSEFVAFVDREIVSS